MRKDDFDFLIELLKKNVGWNLGEDKYFIIDRKMYNFVREKNYASVEDLITELHLGQKTLLWQVIEALALSDTSFYRDYKVFTGFEDRILPHLREANRDVKKLRIWSLGCSSGQETYSIAISVKNRMFAASDWDIKIIGTDLSTASISKAQRGVYNNFEIQMGLNARTIIENFHQDGDVWQVNNDIKKLIEFRRHNLLDDVTFYDPFDVVFCRNVLRFFTPEKQEEAIARIHKNQIPGGFLYLGLGESIQGIEKYYNQLKGMKCLYQAKVLSKEELEAKAQETTQEKPQVVEAPSLPKFVRPEGLTPLSSGPIHKVTFDK